MKDHRYSKHTEFVVDQVVEERLNVIIKSTDRPPSIAIMIDMAKDAYDQYKRAAAQCILEMEKLYEKKYDSIDNWDIETGTFEQWCKSVEAYAVLEGSMKQGDYNEAEMEADWREYYEHGLSARDAYENMYYE